MTKTLKELADELDEISKKLFAIKEKALSSQLWCITEDIESLSQLEYDVNIDIDGGCATIISCPDNVHVHIHDFDLPHCESCGSNDITLKCPMCGSVFCGECGEEGGPCKCWVQPTLERIED